MNSARSRLIAALDVPDRTRALDAASVLAPHVGMFKVGLELFAGEGPQLLSDMRQLGADIFLDLKLHDIPNTVGAAVRSACRHGIRMLTVHAAGGARMLETARSAAESAPAPPLILAVTALTSLAENDLGRMGVPGPVGAWVERLAAVAFEAGIRGFVASPAEVPALRRRFGSEIRIVTPGIRPRGSEAQDQARIATPAEAVAAGSDYLVVGRPILGAVDRAAAAEAVVAEIAAALTARAGNT